MIMESGDSIIFSEISGHHPERSPDHRLEIVFPGKCETVDSLLARLDSITRGADDITVLLQEFDLNFDEVFSRNMDIADKAKEKHLTIIMAVENRIKSTGVGVDWEQRLGELSGKGIETETNANPLSNGADSIGFYFDGSGRVYCFPKSWQNHPVHKIPGTKIGVTICGEIGHVKPEDIDGLDVLYNPSREADDPYLTYRMMGLCNPNVTRDDIIQEMRTGSNRSIYLEMLDDSVWEKFKTEHPDLYNEEFDSHISREKRFNAAVDEYWRIAREHNRDSSGYVRSFSERAKQNRLPVIRADMSDVDGVLNPFDGLNVEIKKSTDCSVLFLAW